MNLSSSILYHLVKVWPSPVKDRQKVLGDPRSDQYHIDYALKYQYDVKVRYGMQIDIRNKRILEIGCGHGGITCFLAANGASTAVGIDINESNLRIAETIKRQISLNLGIERATIPAEFLYMSATALSFPEGCFDVVIADNVFEHFEQPVAVLDECYRVLKSGGVLYVPSMPSIYSKYGLHLKIGLKIPWANLVFSERTICNVMKKLAAENRELLVFYPGLSGNPQRVKDLRAHQDLNGITYAKFRRMAIAAGFSIESFETSPSPRYFGSIVSKLPLLNRGILGDIFSSKAICRLVKK